ncbi:WD40-repeat-containing domain [Pseudocohnilembus persalinus]|uniref:WD40-repeat-containing domain n=1 Tax=Pseudocohnilembus persalinus TaxID=266149 RepID=A0A0V0QGT6_PSEPJ|nr:WD40-repeat-containing domain [Pseudocohnilembus persalinus]|eukprot:KRX01437.1 WD40-repeat-containing domain [Pseudocohnilembus persalinus]
MEKKQPHNCKLTEICLANTCDQNKVHCNECKTVAHKFHGKYVISTQLFKQKLIEYRDNELAQYTQTKNFQLSQQSDKQPAFNKIITQLSNLKNSFNNTISQLEHLIYEQVPDLELINSLSLIDSWGINEWKKSLQVFNLIVDKKQIKQIREFNLNPKEPTGFNKDFIEMLNQLQSLQDKNFKEIGLNLLSIQNQGFSKHLKRKIDHSKIVEDSSFKVQKKLKSENNLSANYQNNSSNSSKISSFSNINTISTPVNSNQNQKIVESNILNGKNQNQIPNSSNNNSIQYNMRNKQPINYNPAENETFAAPKNIQNQQITEQQKSSLNLDENSSDQLTQTSQQSQIKSNLDSEKLENLSLSKKQSNKNNTQRAFTEEQKLQILKEALENININKTAEKYNISRGVIVVWKKVYGNFPQLRELNIRFEKQNKFIPNCHKKKPQELLEKSFETIYNDTDNQDRLRLLTILKSVADHEKVVFPLLQKVQYLDEYLDYYSKVMKQQNQNYEQKIENSQKETLQENQVDQNMEIETQNQNQQKQSFQNEKPKQEETLQKSQKIEEEANEIQKNNDQNQKKVESIQKKINNQLTEEQQLVIQRKSQEYKFDQEYNQNLIQKIIKQRENANNELGMQNIIQLPILNQEDQNYLCGVDSEPYLFIGSNGKMIKIFKKQKGSNVLKCIQDLQYDNSVILQIKKFYYQNCYYLFVLRDNSNINIWNLSKKKMIIDQFKLSQNPSEYPVLDVEIIDEKSEFYQKNDSLNEKFYPILYAQSNNGEISKYEIQIQNDQNQDKIQTLQTIKLQNQFRNKIFRCLKQFQIKNNSQQKNVISFVFQNKIALVDQEGQFLQEIVVKEQNTQDKNNEKINQEEKINYKNEDKDQQNNNNSQIKNNQEFQQNIIDINGFEFNHIHQNFVISQENGFLYLYSQNQKSDETSSQLLNFTKMKVKSYQQKSQQQQQQSDNTNNSKINNKNTKNSEDNNIVAIRKFWKNENECNILVIYPNSCSLQKFNEDIHSYKRLNFPLQHHKIGYNSIGMIIQDEQQLKLINKEQNLPNQTNSEDKLNDQNVKKQQQQLSLFYSIHPNEIRLFVK